MKTNAKKYNDTLTMTKRCLLLSKRNTDMLITSIMVPALMMLLFVSLFGKLINIEGISYVNYIVPGILLQCIGECSASTAILMNKDVTSGIVDRFCTLPIKKLSILNGHVLEAVVRNTLTTVVVLVVATFMGFRPTTSLMDWGILIVLIIGIVLALSWLAILVGVVAKSAEGASSMSMLAVILPYLSSGFVPIDSMPKALAVFAKYQPMTPIIDTMRNALLGKPLDVRTFTIALFWCAGLIIVFYFVSLALFKKRLNK